jgi:hypothetical protein
VSYLYTKTPVLCANVDPGAFPNPPMSCGFFVYYNVSTVGAAIDYIQSGSNFRNGISSAAYTSATFDTGFSSAPAQILAYWTVDDTTPYFEIQHATSTTGKWIPLTSSTGTNIVTNRYVRYLSSFTTINEQDGTSYISSVTFLSRSSGTYYSSVHNAPNLSAWDVFAVSSQDGGGSHTFYTRSSTSSFTILSSTPTWVAQTAGQTVAASTGTYFQARDDFGVSVATTSPELASFSFSWIEGSVPVSMASAVLKDRYYLSLATTTSASANDAILVLGRNFSLQRPVWSVWSLHAGTLLVHQSNLYYGNNSANGKFDRMNVGTEDDGNPIPAYLTTKNFSLGNITTLKLFDTLYMTAPLGDFGSVDSTYYLDGDLTTAYSLGSFDLNEGMPHGFSSSGLGLNIHRLPFALDDSGEETSGHAIMFKWSPTLGEQTWKILGGVLNYRERPVQ